MNLKKSEDSNQRRLESLRLQAEEFKQAVRDTALHYIKEAIKSDRTTLTAEFERQGHKDMADIIRRL